VRTQSRGMNDRKSSCGRASRNPRRRRQTPMPESAAPAQIRCRAKGTIPGNSYKTWCRP
jgi:hypothetical protein